MAEAFRIISPLSKPFFLNQTYLYKESNSLLKTDSIRHQEPFPWLLKLDPKRARYSFKGTRQFRPSYTVVSGTFF